MKGIIIKYLISTPREINKINSFLFGRVIKSKQHGTLKYYYYPGKLENTKYLKLTNGCYFIFDSPIVDYNNIRMIECELDISENEMITAKEYFRKYYEGINVMNL